MHLIWQIQAGQTREAVQRNFLKYTRQTFKRNLQINHGEVLKIFRVNAKDREYPRLTGRAGNMGKKSFKH